MSENKELLLMTVWGQDRHPVRDVLYTILRWHEEGGSDHFSPGFVQKVAQTFVLQNTISKENKKTINKILYAHQLNIIPRPPK